jgi:hypothetical protein
MVASAPQEFLFSKLASSARRASAASLVCRERSLLQNPDWDDVTFGTCRLLSCGSP